MKKLFLRLIGFFVFATCIYALLVFLVGRFFPQDFKKNLVYLKGSYGHTYSRLKDAEKIKNIDVLILGSSHAYRGIDTRIFDKNGLQVFNLGTSSQTPEQSKMLLERYLDKMKPKAVIFETNPAAFSIDGIESSLDIIANLPSPDLAGAKLALKNFHIKLFNTLLFKVLENAVFGDHGYIEPVFKNGDTYIVNSGYVQRNLSYNSPGPIKEREYKFRKDQVKAFENMVKMIKSRDIPLYLIQAPVTSNYNKANLRSREIDEFFQNYGNYRNFNEIIQLDDSLHFYDPHHLNQKGAELFTERVFEYFLTEYKW